MKKKPGAQEHTIIIGTILASILVFVLGFFLGRVWILMPQEKMVDVKKEPAPVVTEPEEVGKPEKEEEFEGTLARLKQQKMLEERKRTGVEEKVEGKEPNSTVGGSEEVIEPEKEEEFEETLARLKQQKMMEEIKIKEAEEKAKRIKEEKMKELALEEKKKEEEQKRKEALVKKIERERLLAQQKGKEEKLSKEIAMAKKRKEELEKEEQRRKLQKQQEEQERKKRQEAQKALEENKKVIKEAPKPQEEKPKPITPPTLTSEGEYFIIQLQSSQNKERVEELLTELRSRGYPAYAIEADLKEKGVWYRIRLGNKYKTYEDAVKDAENLKSKGIISNYWITKR